MGCWTGIRWVVGVGFLREKRMALLARRALPAVGELGMAVRYVHVGEPRLALTLLHLAVIRLKDTPKDLIGTDDDIALTSRSYCTPLNSATSRGR
jgi:hypothetical protein